MKRRSGQATSRDSIPTPELRVHPLLPRRKLRFTIRQDRETYSFLEYVPIDQDVQDPLDVFGIYRFWPKPTYSINHLVDALLHLRKHANTTGKFSSSILSAHSSDVIFFWQVVDDIVLLDQQGIERLFEVDTFRFRLIYIRRSHLLSWEEITSWRNRLSEIRAVPGALDSAAHADFGAGEIHLDNDHFQSLLAKWRLLAFEGKRESLITQLLATIRDCGRYSDPSVRSAANQLLAKALVDKAKSTADYETWKTVLTDAAHRCRLALEAWCGHPEPAIIPPLSQLCDILSFWRPIDGTVNLVNASAGFHMLEKLNLEDEQFEEAARAWVKRAATLLLLDEGAGGRYLVEARDHLLELLNLSIVDPEALGNMLDEIGSQWLQFGQRFSAGWFQDAMKLYDLMKAIMLSVDFDAKVAAHWYFLIGQGQIGADAGMRGYGAEKAKLEGKKIIDVHSHALGLLLRPLRSTRELYVENAFAMFPGNIIDDFEPPRIPIEAALTRAFLANAKKLSPNEVEVMFRLIAVGGPDILQGVEKIQAGSTEAIVRKQWREGVAAYIETAIFILVIVGDTEGLLWEIGEIRNREAFGKLVVTIPPGEVDDRSQRGWKGIRTLWRREGLWLPEYDPEGGFLLISGRGEVEGRLPFIALFNGESRWRLCAHPS